MRRTVQLVQVNGEVELSLGRTQFDLVKRVLLTFFEGERPDIVTRAITGTNKVELLAVIDRAASDESGTRTQVRLSVPELHSLYASLLSAVVEQPSEEAFYLRVGFFREHVYAFVRGLIAALDASTHSGDE
jgi:hypothetical protein